MRYSVILVILLLAMCIGQEEAPEKLAESEQQEAEKGPPPVPDELIQEMIHSYFEALNRRDLNKLRLLTHSNYEDDVQPFLEFVMENDLSFEIVSVSFLMNEEEFRNMTRNLTDEEFAQQMGKRGVSYEMELKTKQKDRVYEGFFLFVYVGETDDGWKILDPSMLQLLIESELEVIQLTESEE